MTITRLKVVAVLLLWLMALDARATDSVELQAVLGTTAVLMIDGQRESLKVGQSAGGVTLLATGSNSVTLEIDGQRQTVGLSQRVGANFQEPAEQVVTITRDARMQYRTNAQINGRSTLVLVDTGANMVALSSVQATAMGIDYSSAVPVQAETAGGVSAAYPVTLRSVDVGGIQVGNVQALVVQGSYPAQVLLGMSYLQHVKIEESNGILSLSRGH